MNEREFNRRNQGKEFKRVMRQIGEDRVEAKKIEQQFGEVPLLGQNQTMPNDPVPTSTLAERLTEGVPIPTTVASLDKKRKQKQEEVGPETAGQYICMEIEKPAGAPTPTHLKMDGVIYLLIPHEHFDQAVDMAYNRGYRRCIDVYGPTHKIMGVPLVIDPVQKTYCQMVLEGYFNQEGGR